MPTPPLDLTEPRADTGSLMALTSALEECQCLFEPRLRLLVARCAQRHLSRALEQPGPLEGIVDERRRLLEVVLGLLTRGERGRPLARSRK